MNTKEEFTLKFPRHFFRNEMPRHWKEVNLPFSRRRTLTEYCRYLVKKSRIKENQHLRSAFANGNLEVYEPLFVAKSDTDWLWFEY